MQSTSVLPWQREDQLQNQLHRNAYQPELMGALAVCIPGLHTRHPKRHYGKLPLPQLKKACCPV